MQLPLSIAAAAPRIANGELRASDWVRACLDQIERLEPQIQAWAALDGEQALAAAEEQDREISAGRCRGPLHGVPLGVKDIIDVAGFPTRAGSPFTSDTPATDDAPCVAKLRAAGAIILGKTITTEFACFDPAPTVNPYDANATPGGSSSGSAAGVAAGMIPAALGSQTGGSVTRPAAYCGVASCKPTFGRVSRERVVPVSQHLDHVGVLAGCVADLAIVLGAMQEDFCDALFWQFSTEGKPPQLNLIADYFLEYADPETSERTLDAMETLHDAGATIVPVELPATFAQVHEQHRRIMAVEAAQVHRERFSAQPENFGPNLASLLNEGLAVTPIDYAVALDHQRRFTHDMAAIPAGKILVTPATPGPAPDRRTTGDPRFNSPWSYCGLPTVSIPLGLSSGGLPLALQFIGPAWSEAELFYSAAWCERVLAVHCAPPILRAE